MKKSTLALSMLGACTALFVSLALLANEPQAQDAKSPNAVVPSGEDGKDTAVRKKMTVGQAIKGLDTMLLEEWKKRDLTPSKDLDDLQWLRRAYLDTVGRIPTLTEVENFRRNEAEGKRDDVVRSLLTSKEHAEYQAVLLRRALISTGGDRVRDGLEQLRSYLEDSIEDNKPWDVMAREMVSFSGEVKNGDLADPGGYMLAMSRNVANLTGNVSRAFLGVEIQCVQCHDDFMVDPEEGGYYQKDFQQMAAIFNKSYSRRKTNDRTNRMEYNTWIVGNRRVREYSDAQIKRMQERIKANPALKERLETETSAPRALRGPEIEGKHGGDLRANFADWMTTDNRLFARTMVNRVWAHYMKRGFVEPVDDFSIINSPTLPKILNYLTDDFMAHDYDVRRLVRVIMGTRAYQLSAELADGEDSANDRVAYSRGYVRQLGALETFNSITAATSLDKVTERRSRQRYKAVRDRLLRQFTFSFDDDEEKENESFSGTIPQALMMMNGEFLNNAVAVAPGSQLYTILKSYDDVEKRVTAMYLAALTREPTKDELRTMRNYIVKDGDGTVAAYEDVFWALVNSAEFLINH